MNSAQQQCLSDCPAIPGLSGERTRLLFASVPAALFANAVLVVLLVMVQWAVISPSRLLGWVGLTLLILIMRAGIYVAFRQAGPREQQWNRWLLRFRGGAIATGMAWGGASLVMFPPADIPHQAFLAFVIAGVSADRKSVV